MPAQATYAIVEDRSGATGVNLRGAARDLWKYKGPEAIIAGPAETGKTFAALFKLDALAWKYPNAQLVLARKIRDTIYPTVLQTYVKKVLGPDTPVVGYGGERPVWFDYPNGSRVWLAGLDDPGKALSSERDFIYVNQAEEIAADDWQVLTTRTTGRAGNAPYGQCFADCNPGPAHHWIKNRESLKIFESRHEDNPLLWDERGGADGKGGWTEQGQRTLAVLDALTGVRKERLRHGRWVSAEGTVYELDPKLHVIDPFPIPANWTRARAIDFGFTNPFVAQFWAIDPDGRLYLYREIYMTGRTCRVHAKQINALSAGETFAITVADHDAEDRATLAESGLVTWPADKAISVGIQAVQSRLQRAGDGKPRLFIFRNALVERDESLAARRVPVCTEQEFDAYVWAKGSDGKPNKEVPVDLHNHGLDCVRYMTMWADMHQRVGGATLGTSTRRSPFAPSSASDKNGAGADRTGRAGIGGGFGGSGPRKW